MMQWPGAKGVGVGVHRLLTSVKTVHSRGPGHMGSRVGAHHAHVPLQAPIRVVRACYSTITPANQRPWHDGFSAGTAAVCAGAALSALSSVLLLRATDKEAHCDGTTAKGTAKGAPVKRALILV